MNENYIWYDGTYSYTYNIGTSGSSVYKLERQDEKVDVNKIVSVTIKDGTVHEMKLKEYILFTSMYRHLPEDCKDSKEFGRKYGVIKI